MIALAFLLLASPAWAASPEGRWRAEVPHDAAGHPAPTTPELQRRLDLAGLPRPGETVAVRDGALCIADQRCQSIQWTRPRLGATQGGGGIAHELGVPQATRVFSGGTGDPGAVLTLVPATGGRMVAVFGLCGPDATNCRNGYQSWTPQ